ncbi:hypothetical protein GCM10011339_23410 [Echinicola rosea]|uniref:Uncharacterized protein n=1 Tax=Echinicola rosea TaxID=1807691 RepID=A0ABQ1V2I2_9BACT|nr:hypothetical protein GCM10011339_23410 [Echinicola rosea]
MISKGKISKTEQKQIRKIQAEKEAIKRRAEKILNDTGDVWFSVWYSQHANDQLKKRTYEKFNIQL